MLTVILWPYLLFIYISGCIIGYVLAVKATNNEAPTWSRLSMRMFLFVFSYISVVCYLYIALFELIEDKIPRKLVPNWLKWL